VYLFFVDDAQQKPTRNGMGPLVATGGFGIPGDAARDLHARISRICIECGFPPREEFKWSPSANHWMRTNLINANRTQFFFQVIAAIKDAGAVAIVAIVDEDASPANSTAGSAKEDATILFLERVNSFLNSVRQDGLVIVDQPGGGRKDETKYLTSCMETLIAGTNYVNFDRIAHNVFTTPSHLSRMLQVADVITSCSLAAIAGEARYSPPVFDAIKGVLRRDYDRLGGVGLKLHPDGKYANLYHWLLGDTHFVRNQAGFPMPLRTYKYAEGPDEP